MSYRRTAAQQNDANGPSDSVATGATTLRGADKGVSSADVLRLLATTGDPLLQLYRAACQLPMAEFQALAIQWLQSILPFDAAWWAFATQVEERKYLHFSYQYELPDYTADLINVSAGDNIVARRCGSEMGTTFNFSPADLFSDVNTGFTAQFMGMQHLLCTQTTGTPTSTWNVVALVRKDASNPFGEDERQLKERLVPHLTQMMDINRFAQLALLRTRAEVPSSFVGIADAHNIVHTFEPGFDAMMRLEWPTWEGILLPQTVEAAYCAGATCYVGKKVIVHFGTADDQTLVVLTRRSKLDQLSPRERVIAKEFAEGSSYKQVAKKLDTSPATVRNHLRNIYQKLEITSKAELSRLYAITPIASEMSEQPG